MLRIHLTAKTVVFTDLDGSLLDPATYSFEAALPALELMRKREVALVLCSSKTRAEMEVYRRRLCNGHPFISENGGGIFIPAGYFSHPDAGEACDGYQVITLGTPHAEIRHCFVRLRKQTGARVRGFSDMSAEEVADLTGLPADEAVLAKARDFDEPFVFDGPADGRFLHAIEAAGFHWTRGRVYHFMGDHDKGRAVGVLLARYRRQFGEVASIGLGDAPNDLPMLMAVDRPVLIRGAAHGVDPGMSIPGLMITGESGPSGWNEVLLSLLSD
jgi:mannosyl-3-phosphoglycerate phosphatase